VKRIGGAEQTYAKADMVRMRTTVEAVESYVQSAKSPVEVQQATAVSGGDQIIVEDERLCTVSEVITPLGFEPIFRTWRTVLTIR
jgi:uncharacterized Zn finger protein